VQRITGSSISNRVVAADVCFARHRDNRKSAFSPALIRLSYSCHICPVNKSSQYVIEEVPYQSGWRDATQQASGKRKIDSFGRQIFSWKDFLDGGNLILKSTLNKCFKTSSLFSFMF
jgi:hypothetical protein